MTLELDAHEGLRSAFGDKHAPLLDVCGMGSTSKRVYGDNFSIGSNRIPTPILQDPLSDNQESKAHLDAAHSVRTCAQDELSALNATTGSFGCRMKVFLLCMDWRCT